MWDAIMAYAPDLFLFAGDNVYGDWRNGKPVPEQQLIEGLAEAYDRGAKVGGLMALRAKVPHFVTWDDHDYGKNDAGADFQEKHQAQKLFLEFWKVPKGDPRSSRDGIYHAETFGPENQRVQVILLDTRFFRSRWRETDQRNAPGKERYLPDDNLGKTMLGAAQWAWLAELLREPAQLRLIVSSVQVVADGHGWERWGNFPRERQKLYDLIAETDAQGVIFLSGDRHIGGIYRETRGVPYPLVDLIASGINQFFASANEAGPNRLGAIYGNPNFGTIDVDWWSGEIRLAVRDGAGQIVREHKVRFDQLRPRS